MAAHSAVARKWDLIAWEVPGKCDKYGWMGTSHSAGRLWKLLSHKTLSCSDSEIADLIQLKNSFHTQSHASLHACSLYANCMHPLYVNIMHVCPNTPPPT